MTNPTASTDRLLPLVLLLALLGVAIGGGAWWLWRGEPTSVEVGPERDEVDRAESLDAPTELEDQRDDLTPVAPDPETRLVRGVVLPPLGAPQDPVLEAFALEDPLTAGGFARALLTPPEGDDEDPFAPAARAAVAADGSFELAFPADWEEGWIQLRGRYLYLARATRVDLLATTLAVEVEPSVGAHLDVRVVLPAGAAPAAGDPTELSLRTEMGNMNPMMAGQDATRLSLKLPAVNGRLAVGALPVEVAYTLAGVHEDYAVPAELVGGLAAGEDRAVVLRLTRGGELRGVVRDEEGAPVPGAEVSAARPGQFFGLDDTEVRGTTADEEGAWSMVGVAPGTLRLRASADGFLDSDRVPVTLEEEGLVEGLALELTLGNGIEGTVTWDDGSGAAGVPIEVGFDMSRASGLDALGMLRGAEGGGRTDAAGHFQVTGLGKGPFVVRAAIEAPMLRGGEGDDVTWRARQAGVRPGHLAQPLVLHPPTGARGRVIDDLGEPVTAFRLNLRRAALGPAAILSEEEFLLSRTFESEHGEFLVEDLEHGAYELWVQDDDHVSAGLVSASLPSTTELLITVLRTARIDGEVRSPGGGLVAGARVSSSGEGTDWTQALQGGPQPASATSGADGTFRLKGIAPGALQLVAESERWARSEPTSIELAPGEHRTEVSLLLSEGGTITGEVYDAAGAPAEGRMVTVVRMAGILGGGGGGLSQRLSRSDGEGAFRIEHLEPGAWHVTALDASREWTSSDEELDLGALMGSLQMTQAEVVEGQVTHVILGAPPVNPVRVQGRISLRGEALSNVTISFHPEGEAPFDGLVFGAAADDGTYELVLDGPGSYVASVQLISGAPGRQSTSEYSVEVPDQAEHRLDFELPLGRISGLVRGPDGEPAVGERLSLRLEEPARSDRLFGSQYSELVTDDEGRFDVVGLRPGAYTIAAGGPGFFGLEAGGLGRVTIDGLILAEGRWLDDVELRLPRPGSLAVSARTPEGPAVGATVFVRDAQGRPVDAFSTAATDGAGTCRVDGLAPGTYTVRARTAAHASQESAVVTVVEGQATAVELDLEAGCVLWVLLKGGDGDPLEGTLRVLDAEGREVSNMIGFADLQALYATGGFSPTEHRLGPLPPGRYRVEATGPDGQTGSKLVRLRPGDEKRLVVRLK